MAERLGYGLQIRLQRFNSASHLQCAGNPVKTGSSCFCCCQRCQFPIVWWVASGKCRLSLPSRQSISTLDLSNCNGTLSATGTTSNSEGWWRAPLKFASGVAITVDLSGRSDLHTVAKSENPYIVTWGSQPSSTFTLDAATGKNFKLQPDGIGIKILRCANRRRFGGLCKRFSVFVGLCKSFVWTLRKDCGKITATGKLEGKT